MSCLTAVASVKVVLTCDGGVEEAMLAVVAAIDGIDLESSIYHVISFCRFAE